MDSGSATTSGHIFGAHSLPHQQFSSRIAYANSYSKTRLNSVTKQKSTTRLPPIARYDSIGSPPDTNESIRYFNISADSNRSGDGQRSPEDLQNDLRIMQLEQSLKFVKEDCRHILEALHSELEELKIKNRDLQFQLIACDSVGLDLNDNKEIFVTKDNCDFEPQVEQYIRKLENEVKRLRSALSETLRINSALRQELQTMSRRQRTESNGNLLSSPTIVEFNKTFEALNKPIKGANKAQANISLPRIANSGSKLK